MRRLAMAVAIICGASGSDALALGRDSILITFNARSWRSALQGQIGPSWFEPFHQVEHHSGKVMGVINAVPEGIIAPREYGQMDVQPLRNRQGRSRSGFGEIKFKAAQSNGNSRALVAARQVNSGDSPLPPAVNRSLSLTGAAMRTVLQQRLPLPIMGGEIPRISSGQSNFGAEIVSTKVDNSALDCDVWADGCGVHAPRFIQSVLTSLRPLFGLFDGLERSVGTAFGLEGGALREDGGAYRGEQRESANYAAPSGNPCLLVGGDGLCVGGARRTSRLYDAVSAFAMLLFCLCAGVSFALSQPDGEHTDFRWLAVCAACLIGMGLFLKALFTGQIWLFGL